MDLLYDAAVAWNRLLQDRYEITYGKNKKLHTIVLEFQPSEFYHLAGFPHAKDVALPLRGSQSKMLSNVLTGKITGAMLEKSGNYETIIKRKLEAIIRLEQLLRSPCQVYLYNPRKLPFYTDIKAKYLLVDAQTQVVFLFTDTEDNNGLCFSRSTFVMGDRDFRINQTRLAVLQTKRTDLSTGNTDVIFCKDGFSN